MAWFISATTHLPIRHPLRAVSDAVSSLYPTPLAAGLRPYTPTHTHDATWFVFIFLIFSTNPHSLAYRLYSITGGYNCVPTGTVRCAPTASVWRIVTMGSDITAYPLQKHLRNSLALLTRPRDNYQRHLTLLPTYRHARCAFALAVAFRHLTAFASLRYVRAVPLRSDFRHVRIACRVPQALLCGRLCAHSPFTICVPLLPFVEQTLLADSFFQLALM